VRPRRVVGPTTCRGVAAEEVDLAAEGVDLAADEMDDAVEDVGDAADESGCWMTRAKWKRAVGAGRPDEWREQTCRGCTTLRARAPW
jgi:hypothetical protein